MKRAVLLSVCGGCSQVLGLEAPTQMTVADAALTDVAADARSGPCVMETFSSPMLDPMWKLDGASGSTLVTQGQLVVVPPPQKMGAFGISTQYTLHLAGGYVELEVVQAASFVTGQYTYFLVATDMNNVLTIMALNNEVRAITTTSTGQTTAMMPWPPFGIRYWRIAFDDTGTKASFEFRNDLNAAWTVLAGSDFSTTPAAGVAFGVGEATSTNASPGEAKFDNVIAECSD